MLQLPVLIFVAGSNDAGALDGFAARVRDRSQREGAICTAMKRALTPEGRSSDLGFSADETCKVNHVIESRGAGQRPAFLVFFGHDWSDDFAAPGKPLGHFALLDADGFLLPWHENSNVLHPGDAVVEQPTPLPALVFQALPVEANCDPGRTEPTPPVRQLHVVSIAQPERPVLSLIAGPKGTSYEVKRKGRSTPQRCLADVCSAANDGSWTDIRTRYAWSWRVVVSGKGISLDVGPADAKGTNRRASYSWNEQSQTFTGPEGSPTQQFIRFDQSKDPRAADRFAVAIGAMTRSCLDQPGCADSKVRP